jgi:pimeloyl-ACP methyl ester carboxylesterase
VDVPAVQAAIHLRELARAWTARVHLLAADPERDALLPAAVLDELCEGQQVTGEVVGVSGHSIHRERPELVVEVARRLTAGPGGTS